MQFPLTVTFDVAPKILNGLLSGELLRTGGVIREAATGQIVKHLVEAPNFTNLATHSMGFLNPALSGAMGLVTTGSSILNLGVSAIGLVYLNHRINQLQKDIQQISGQLAYLQKLITQTQQELLEVISELHRALFIQHFSQLQAELLMLQRSPDTPVQNALKVATQGRLFFCDQAHSIQRGTQPRALFLGDVALKGWAAALATESQLLLKQGSLAAVQEAHALLKEQTPQFREIVQQWCLALLPTERPQLHSAYAYQAPQFQKEIPAERVQRLLRLSPQDNALTPQQRYNRERDVRVEFAMTYFGQLPPSWFQTQIAYAEFLDTFAETSERLESLEAFAALCERCGEVNPFAKLPSDPQDQGLYLLDAC